VTIQTCDFSRLKADQSAKAACLVGEKRREIGEKRESSLPPSAFLQLKGPMIRALCRQSQPAVREHVSVLAPTLRLASPKARVAAGAKP
jgi:hypothetical protein